MPARPLLTRIARHECRVLVAEKASWVVLVLLAVAISYGVANGLQSFDFQQTTLTRAAAEEAQRYDDLKQQVRRIDAGTMRAPFADPRMPDAAGSRLAWRYAAMPPLPLSTLSIGQSDLLPSYFRVSTASRESVLTTNEIANPHRLLHGRFDLSFVVVYLFPLLIVGLTYNVISSERESGTLALVLSQPVSLRTLMAAKIGLRAALVALVVIACSVIGLLAVRVDLLSSDGWLRLLLWSGVVAAYGCFWFGAVMLVTSFGRSSATNALALAAVWLVLVVVLPSALNMIVSVLYPMPSRVDMLAALRAATDEASAKGNQLLAKYYGDHPELAAVSDMDKAKNDVAITRLAIDDEVEERVRPVVDRYDVQLARQQRLIDRFRLLSPAIVAQDALNDVAGTGSARYRHFVSLVDAYHEGWRALFASMIVSRQKLTPDTYDALPRFIYEEEPIRAVLTRASVGLLVLFAIGAMCGFIGTARLRRYPVAA
jgi:ABC-2 type transport system permease protein